MIKIEKLDSEGWQCDACPAHTYPQPEYSKDKVDEMYKISVGDPDVVRIMYLCYRCLYKMREQIFT